jgi:DNA primase
MNIRVAKITNKRAYCYCCFHKDSKPSLEIKLEGEHLGEYYCYSCGKAGILSPILLSQLLEKKKNNKKIDKRVAEIDWNRLDYKYTQDIEWLKNNKPFDVSESILFDLHCGWDGETWTFPMRDRYNNIIGIQRRFKDGFKSMVEGSRLGIFIPQIELDYNQIFVCEGVSDTTTILDMGYYAIGRPNNQYGDDIIKSWLSDWARVYIMADNDKPGITGAMVLAKYIGISEDHVLIPKMKDIREQTDEYGEEQTKCWINERIKL